MLLYSLMLLKLVRGILNSDLYTHIAMRLEAPNFGVGPNGRRQIIAQVRRWLDEKQTPSDIITALSRAGYTRAKIGEYLAIAEDSGELDS